MSARLELVTKMALAAETQAALTQLHTAVHPPELAVTSPGAAFHWAPSQWAFLVWHNQILVAHVGLVVREILSNGVPKRIGGIGGVMTHPDYRGQGFAIQGLEAAATHFTTTLGVAYALLFCGPHLIPFYNRTGWQAFHGQVYVDQPTGKIAFSAERVMVRAIQEAAPQDGVLDLQGLPW